MPWKAWRLLVVMLWLTLVLLPWPLGLAYVALQPLRQWCCKGQYPPSPGIALWTVCIVYRELLLELCPKLTSVPLWHLLLVTCTQQCMIGADLHELSDSAPKYVRLDGVRTQAFPVAFEKW